jgi:acetate kinase
MRVSSDAILVLNAGSSSLKLTVFAERAGELARELHGEIEGLYTAPRFRAYDPAGHVVAEKSWGNARLGHDGAVEYLGNFVEQHLADHRLVAVGHRVVHGGLEFTAPVRVTPATVQALERLIPLRPCTSRTACRL